MNDVLAVSSKGRGSVRNTKGIGGGEEGSLLENDEDMYFVFPGSVPGYSDGHSWVNVKFLFGGMSFSLAALSGQREEGLHPHESQLLVFSCLWLYYDKLHFLFFVSLDWHCWWMCFHMPLRNYWWFARYVILCKAAVNVHKVVFSFSPSRRRFSQQIQTETPWFHTSWIHLLGRVTSVSDLCHGRTTFPWG